MRRGEGVNIYPIDASSVGAVAELMSAVKPDWWDYEGAFEQLRNEKLLARLVGWYIGEENRPRGWLLCAEYEGAIPASPLRTWAMTRTAVFPWRGPWSRCCAGPRPTPGKRGSGT